MRTLVAILALLLGFGATAQTGIVKGKVVNPISGEPEPFVPVSFTVSKKVTAVTDFDGMFEVEAPAGRDTIKLSPSTGEVTLFPVVIKANEVNEFDIQLKAKAATEFNDIEVKANFKPKAGSEEEALKEAQDSENGVAVQSASAAKKKGASSGEDMAATATGVSSASRMIFVRGLGDRYNVAYLNGLPMPSPDPDFRVIPLDLFPIDVLTSVGVTKTLSTDFFGDYSGGVIDMRTVTASSTPFFKVGVSSGMNSMTTGKDYMTYAGGKTDYFGFDNGARSIPDFVLNKSLEKSNKYFPQGIYRSKEGEGTGFGNNVNPIRTTAMPNSGFNLSGGRFWKWDSTTNSKDPDGIGFVMSMAHDVSQNYSEGRMALINANNAEKLDYEVYKYTQNISSSFLTNLNMVFRDGKDNINLNVLGLNLSSDEARETYGFHFDYTDTVAGTRNIFTRRYTYKQNSLGALQLMGNHDFMGKDHPKLQVKWAAHYAIAKSNEPDRRQFVWFYDDDQRDDPSVYTINATDVNDNHRFFSWLTEKELDAKGEVNYHIIQKPVDSAGKELKNMLSVRAGFDYKDKKRSFDYRQFNYNMAGVLGAFSNSFDVEDPDRILNDANHDNGLFYIDELANPGSAYTATLNVMAPYAAVKFNTERIMLVGGLRTEIGDLQVVNRNQQIPSQMDVNGNSGIAFMPSLNTKFILDEKAKHQLRVGASRSITRPKFNEIAPFQYILYFAGTKAQGNPALENGTNYNVDLGYGWFNRSGAMISVGTFYKYLQNPIEMTMQGTASGQLQSFQNAEKGQVAGLELELIQDLGFLAGEGRRDSTIWKYFSINVNGAYMWNQVSMDSTDGAVINTNFIRPLEGASPWLANVGLSFDRKFYNREKKRSIHLIAGVSYGSFGRRLSSVGAQGIGDQYELPVHTLNAMLSVELNARLKVGISAKNLLNASYRVVQENSSNPSAEPFLVNEYKKGVNLGVSVSYKILNGTKTKEKK